MALTIRQRTTAATAVLALAAGLTAVAAVPTSASAPGVTTAVVDPALRAAHGTVGIIVTGSRAAERAVVRAGGTVTHELPIIGGFSAKVPANDVPTIARVPGVQSVSLDRPTHVQSSPGTYNNLPSVYKSVTNGDKVNGIGGDGHGVTVALIDTGVSALPDVASAIVPVSDPTGAVVNAPCVNMTSEPNCNDSYGHGTFMAGLIAGNGSASLGKYVGMAPQARIISVKVAGASGASDVSTIIAALQWVAYNQSTYNIRVVNLSLGTDSTQSYTVDPLDYAVEKVWQAGVVVDVAASNRGPGPQTISDPANDPFVITVGAVDDKGTNGFGDDVLPDFSSRGPTATDLLPKPDVVAPGAHLVSLAAPGAAITTQFPPTMAAPYRRGSGTSMANAVVTGLVADLISANPSLTPDRVKFMLTSTAHKDASTDPLAVGAGVVDGWAALSAPAGLANVGVTPSNGSGSLAASRGTVQFAVTGLSSDGSTVVVDASSGDVTPLLPTVGYASLLTAPTDGTSWWGTSWWGTSWWGTSWWGTSWWGTSWWGTSWWGNSWDGASQNGQTDTSNPDYGLPWYAGAWLGAWDQ